MPGALDRSNGERPEADTGLRPVLGARTMRPQEQEEAAVWKRTRVVSPRLTDQAQQRLFAILANPGAPDDAGLFARRTDDYAAEFLYLTPSAARYAEELLPRSKWEPSKAPPRDGTVLLVGNGNPNRLLE